jgi:hypothetical protein
MSLLIKYKPVKGLSLKINTNKINNSVNSHLVAPPQTSKSHRIKSIPNLTIKNSPKCLLLNHLKMIKLKLNKNFIQL